MVSGRGFALFALFAPTSERVLGRKTRNALHSVNQAWIDAYEFENSQAALVQALHLSTEDRPVDVCLGIIKGGEGVEHVHFPIHNEGSEGATKFTM